MSTRPRRRSPAEQATFVFKGTVQKLKGATMQSVPVDDKTLVVRVDRVLQAPEPLLGSAGRDITVQLSEQEKLRRGEEAVFYTNGWLFGDSLAVRSVGHTDVKRGLAGLSGSVSDPVQAKSEKDLRGHVADADLVVSGRVSSVRLAPGASRRAGGSRPAIGQIEPISEHAGLWREAVIDVNEVGKGRGSSKQVIVRFPSSTDVRWAHVPKFHPGQEGIFLLHRSGAERNYTALHSQDFQPLKASQGIRTLFKAALGRKPSPAKKAR